MNEAKAIARCEEAAALLPPRFRRAALQMPDHRKRYTEEFRLRAGQPPAALLPEGEVTLPYFGADSRVTPRDLAQMVDAVTDYSRYACAETLRQGFLCLHGGFRLGVCGTAVLRNGAVASLRDISSLSLRIVTERIGLAEPTADSLFCAGAFRSTLLLSPPGGGKTTLLRDLIRTLSFGSEDRAALRVAVVDERGEIAVFQDVALALDRAFFRIYVDLFYVAVLIGRFRRGTRFAVGYALEPKPRDRPLVGCETEYNWFISHNNPFSVISD